MENTTKFVWGRKETDYIKIFNYLIKLYVCKLKNKNYKISRTLHVFLISFTKNASQIVDENIWTM